MGFPTYTSRFFNVLCQYFSNFGTTSFEESGGFRAQRSLSVRLLRKPVRARGSNQLNVSRLGNPDALSGHWF